jgi:membrane protein YqaA with SNARE-associated domain
MLLLGTFCYCIGSALVPLLNAEAYISAVAAMADNQLDTTLGLWVLAVVAAGGQMVGKTVWYMAGRHALDWAWLARKTAKPRWQAALARWQGRIGDRAWVAALVLLASATVGFPPFAILSVIAGQLRIALPLFLVTGMVGRTLRFAGILGAAGWLTHVT